MGNAGFGDIRPVGQDDWPQLYSLIERQFMRKDEARLIESLQKDKLIVYALLIERNGDFNGAIFFSRIHLLHDGASYDALALGPIVVDHPWQGRGLGGTLIEHGHRDLAAAGEKIIFVLGEADYYRRFGYSVEAAKNYECPYAGPFFLGLRCSDEVPASGKLIYPEAFSRLSS